MSEAGLSKCDFGGNMAGVCVYVLFTYAFDWLCRQVYVYVRVFISYKYPCKVNMIFWLISVSHVPNFAINEKEREIDRYIE